MIIGGITSYGGDANPYTAQNGETERADGDTGNSVTDDIGYWRAEKFKTSAGSQNFGATSSTQKKHVITVFELKPIAAYTTSTSSSTSSSSSSVSETTSTSSSTSTSISSSSSTSTSTSISTSSSSVSTSSSSISTSSISTSSSSVSTSSSSISSTSVAYVPTIDSIITNI